MKKPASALSPVVPGKSGLGYYVERSKAVADGLSLRMSVETQDGLPSA